MQNMKGIKRSPRMDREERTIAAMVQIYCHDKHKSRGNTLCAGCEEFLQYARHRLSLCPYQEQKPTCGNCPIHCYKKDMQEKARRIMRYSGPRMIHHHPIMALRHILDSRKPAPKRRFRKARKEDPAPE